MKLAQNLRSFIADPRASAVAGTTWLYFQASEDLCGFVLWGRPSEADVIELETALRTELSPSATPHASLVDVRRIEDIDPAAFDRLGAYLRANRARLSEVVTRLCVVRPVGMMGALAAGFFGVEEPPYPVNVADDPEHALTWLGIHAGKDLVGEIEELSAQASGVVPLLRNLRALLETKPGRIALGEAASTLGVSERNLQRKLRALGTSYQAEQSAAQVRVARVLLSRTDAKLSQVALDVGCGSLATFSTLYRRITGETPSDYRARARKTRPA